MVPVTNLALASRGDGPPRPARCRASPMEVGAKRGGPLGGRAQAPGRPSGLDDGATLHEGPPMAGTPPRSVNGRGVTSIHGSQYRVRWATASGDAQGTGAVVPRGGRKPWG